MLWLALVILVASVLIPIALRRVRAILRAKASKRDDPGRCRCSYEMVGLSLPRCPECGRVIGFDKTFEQMGLTEDDLARIAERRRAREQVD